MLKAIQGALRVAESESLGVLWSPVSNKRGVRWFPFASDPLYFRPRTTEREVPCSSSMRPAELSSVSSAHRPLLLFSPLLTLRSTTIAAGEMVNGIL